MIKEYLNKYREEIKKCIEDLKSKDTFYRQIPNLLTISRALGMIPVNILFFTGNIVPATVLIGLLLSTDFFDGKFARKYNIVSKFGADLDAICDKLMVLGLTLPLLFSNSILILNLIFEGLITGVNVIGRVKGMDTKTVYTGKVKTLFLSLMLVLGYLVQFFGVSRILLLISSVVTMITQGVTFKVYLDEYDKMKREKDSLEIKKNYEELDNGNDIEEDDKIINQLVKEKEFFISMDELNREETSKKKVRKKE